MIRTFFKTVFLVIIIGLIHGLVFLPVLLSIFVRRATCFDKKARQRKVEPAESVGIPDEDDPLPYGRYGIYLPRLTHIAEYYPAGSKGGDILHWYHPQNHHNPLQRRLSAVAVLMPHPSMSRIPSVHSLASMHIVPPPPIGAPVFPIVYGTAHPAAMFFGPPAPPPPSISTRSTPEIKHRQRILQQIPTVRQHSVGSHSLQMSKSSEDLSKYIHPPQGHSGIALGGLRPGMLRATSVTPGASRKSSMIMNSSSSARASGRKHSNLRRKISDSEAEVLRAAAGRLAAGIPQFHQNPDGSWSAFYPGQYPNER